MSAFKPHDDATSFLGAWVDSTPDAIVGTDLDGVVMMWNKSAESLYGYSAADMIGQSVSILIPPDRADELRALLNSDPFPGLTHGRGTYLTATFLRDGATTSGMLPKSPDPLTRIVGYDKAARVFLAVIDNGQPGQSPDFMAWLDKTYGKDITTRTWLTVQRIVKKLES